MGCLISLLLTFVPRLILLIMWLATPLVNLAIDNRLVTLLGFIFLPFTTLAYVLAWDAIDGVTTAGWLLVIVGLLLDLGTYAVSGYFTRARRMAAESSKND
jgi:hypothetical protein